MSGNWQQKLKEKNKEYNEGGIPPQGRKKDWSPFRHNRGRRSHRYHHVQSGHHLHSQEGDDILKKRNVQEGSKVRYIPYSARRERGIKYQHKECNNITEGRNGKRSEKLMAMDTEDEIQETWFKITIPNGKRYEKKWLLDSIRRHCRLPFNPVDFHYVRKWARFFVQNSSTAYALKNVSNKIFDENNKKIAIFISKSSEPYSVRNKLQPEEMKQLELAMHKRYDVFQRSLDLQSFRFDSDFVNRDIDIYLNRRQCMSAVLQIIEKNFPELLSLNLSCNKLYQLDGLSDIVLKVPTIKSLDLSRNKLKSMWEVSKMKILKLEALWLEGNPLCKGFQNQSSYISAVQELFPKLLYLDGQKIQQPVVDIDMPCLKTSSDGGYEASEEVKKKILQFLQQYYMIYDHENRLGLLNAYHDDASFSLSIPFNPNDTSQSGLCKYFKNSRNAKVTDQRIQLQERTKHAILRTLCMLPHSQHDLSSFLIDVWMQSETMLCFSVNGKFKEVEDKSPGSVYAFVRNFITVPATNSGMCIMNDELYVMDSTNNEIQRAVSASVSKPSSSSESTLSQKQQDLVQAFSTQSGMNLQWSYKCLQENEWDFLKASHIFTVLKTEGKIPEVAFKQSQ